MTRSADQSRQSHDGVEWVVPRDAGAWTSTRRRMTRRESRGVPGELCGASLELWRSRRFIVNLSPYSLHFLRSSVVETFQFKNIWNQMPVQRDDRLFEIYFSAIAEYTTGEWFIYRLVCENRQIWA